MSFRFLPPAEAELLEGISYYSAFRPELGMRFEQAVAEAVRNADVQPQVIEVCKPGLTAYKTVYTQLR